MARGGKVCIELNFTRGGDGKSRKAKMKSFWEFIDSRKDLVPVQPESQESITKCKYLEDPKHSSACCDNRDYQSLNESSREYNREGDNSDVGSLVVDQSPPERSIWDDELQILKKLGLDRVALAASDTCKRCVRDERNNVEKSPVLADCVPESYDELAADMKKFQDRVKLRKPQCSYKEPGKYAHLV